MIPIFIHLNRLNDHVDAEENANDSDRDEPAGVVHEPGKVEALFLAVVILEEVERLHAF